MNKRSLSIGKIRGLQGTSKNNIFSILAFDHRQSFVKLFSNNDQEKVNYDDVVTAKLQVVQSLGLLASAVLLDPVFGASQSIASDVLSGQTGLVISLEETSYSGETTGRLTEMLKGWNLEKIKRMGADAVKLLLYYHPFSSKYAKKQEQLVKRVIERCNKLDLAFFLEPVTYSIDPNNDKNSILFANDRPQIIAETAYRLGALEPDVLKLEFPIAVNHNMDKDQWYRACINLTEASPCPWTVLSAGVGFDLFAEQVEVACKAGASGFIAGQSLWKDGILMSKDQRKNWLDSTAADRFEKLAKIAEQYAIPWQNHFQKYRISELENWYQTY